MINRPRDSRTPQHVSPEASPTEDYLKETATLRSERLNAADVDRLAEFFDGRVDRVFEFARTTWLPDAGRSLAQLAEAIRTADARAAYFLCDHVREGARTVGAERIAFLATCIQLAVEQQRYRDAAYSCERARRALRVIESWLAGNS